MEDLEEPGQCAVITRSDSTNHDKHQCPDVCIMMIHFFSVLSASLDSEMLGVMYQAIGLKDSEEDS